MSSPLAKGLAHYLYLMIVLVGVYLAMALLSGLDTQGHPANPAHWRFDVPRFIVQEQSDGSWAFNSFNQRKILEQAAINLTLGVGMTFVILTGGIDLSVGSMLALCNVVFVQVVLAIGGQGPPGFGAVCAGMLVCVLAGTLCGMGNGVLSARLRIPSFIVTLGTLLVLRGAAYWISGGETKLLACPAGMTVGIPIVVPVVAVAVAGLFLASTSAGRKVYAVGGNLLACEYSGVRTSGIRVMCFAFSGLCAGLAGMIYWSRVATGSYTAGEGAELFAIAAVVLGGTRLAGGRGSVVGTLIGALIMAVLANGLNTASIHESTQKIIVGCVLVAAAYIDSRRNRGVKAVVL